jgi:hypothetical protein
MIVGSGRFLYRVNADWAKLPEGWSFKEVGGVGVDTLLRALLRSQ